MIGIIYINDTKNICLHVFTLNLDLEPRFLNRQIIKQVFLYKTSFVQPLILILFFKYCTLYIFNLFDRDEYILNISITVDTFEQK